MTTAYDKIAWQYQKAEKLPFRQHAEMYTYFQIVGEIAGKTILDLACGEGFYTRELKHMGAKQVVGVDISEKMIELAQQQEAEKPLGIEYIVGDVLELKKLGSFDLVVASYLLHYAQTKEQLLKMCQNIYVNLKPDTRFVSINANPEQPVESFQRSEKYGFTKSISTSLQEGTPITTIISGVDQTFCFDIYHFNKATYEWALHCAGFKEIRWHSPIISPDGIQEFGQTYWQDFIDYPAIIGIECFK